MAVFIAPVLVVCLGAPAEAESEPIEIVFSTYWPVSYKYLWLPVKHFAEKVEKQSSGRVRFKLYHSKKLYNGKDEFGALERGDIDMSSPSDIYHAKIIPELGITSLPFLFNNPESLQKILDAGLWDLGITQKLLEHNIVVLSVSACDPYQIYSKGFQVLSPGHIKGKKWGVSGTTHSKAVEILGGTPETMSSGKLYMAFQKGGIDGCTRPLITGCGRYLYETVDYLTITNFAHLSSFLCINRKKWDSLPEDIREIMKKAGKEQTREQLWRVNEYIDESIKLFKKKDVSVHIAMPEQTDKFRKAMSPVYDWWVNKVPDGKKYIEFVRTHR